MKPYRLIPIVECGDPLVPIPSDLFSMESPHPYAKLGAPYGNKSPYFVRSGVLNLLLNAQQKLQVQQPKWRIHLFDAYRPIAVQQFMVDHAFQEVLQQQGLQEEELSDDQQATLRQQVYQFWAIPSHNPATPPPHSTGAAIDITLVNQWGDIVDMGSPIDEISPRSFPDYFAPNSPYSSQWTVKLAIASSYHQQRTLLNQIMTDVGFRQHSQEWWHFSYGDQLWAWLDKDQPQTGIQTMPVARYGGI
ncbi:MAG: D-alanyl-D-alanine dipeptidase [Merismopedia sp. SIO2A8]|nr:D-alanyl-D-alanine dipeptidase [Merismopedia sp. SIO2A8]